MWIRFDTLGTRMDKDASIIGRILAPYVTNETRKFRTHPVTGAALERRMRWTGLDLLGMLRDGLDLDTPDVSG